MSRELRVESREPDGNQAAPPPAHDAAGTTAESDPASPAGDAASVPASPAAAISSAAGAVPTGVESARTVPADPAGPAGDAVSAAVASPRTGPAAPDPAGAAELPELLPARMLNEFAYCPRLGYLEWVQGEWAENLETLQGTFGHRNVDKPSRAAVPAASPESRDDGPEPDGGDADALNSQPSTLDSPIHSRSLMLSAPGEGLIAKMDLLELDGNVATPVDYKRGSVPDVPEGAYEPERVQLCAQGLILRENGFDCRQGVLYYIASRRRVTVAFDEALVARTRELNAGFRRAAAAAQLPPPLVDSPKCPRCSLVGICLPDEVNLLRQIGADADGDALAETNGDSVEGRESGVGGRESEIRGQESEVGNQRSKSEEHDPSADADHSPLTTHDSPTGLRRLIPTRDDALPLYLQEHGLSLGKKGEQLVVKKKGQQVRAVRMIDVSQVCVFGSAHVTEPALRELTTRGVPVCHLSYGGWFYALTSGLVHKNVELRIRQFAAAADPLQALPLARQFVIGKIRNCRTLLRRHLESNGRDRDRERMLWQLAEYAKKAERAASAETLLGIEGTAAKVYFSGFARLLKGGDEFDIDGRNRRPPRDPVNALLSFVYAMLVKELTVTLQGVGFDPMLGVYHQPRYGRPSLALDLAEEFRPLVADSTVLTLVNNGEVSASSFIRRAGSVALTDAGRRAVLAAFERRLSTEITHPIFGYRATYRRILEVQSRLLARTILGELPEYPSFCTR